MLSEDGVWARLRNTQWESIEPKPIDADRYSRVNEEFIDAVLPHPDVISIYGDSKTPTVPGVSDADFTVIVEDDLEDLEGLERRVRSVVSRYSKLCDHGPGILPESVAKYYPWFDPHTLALEPLAGRVIDPEVEVTRLAAAGIVFDNFIERSCAKFIRELLPSSSIAYTDTRMVKFANSVLSSRRTAPILSPDLLVLDKRTGLRLMSSPKHTLEYVEKSLRRETRLDTTVLDRAAEFRSSYFDFEPDDERYFEFLADLLTFSHQLRREFVHEQPLYYRPERSSTIKNTFPMLATPRYRELSVDEVVELCFNSATPGSVVSPAVAHHVATLPYASDFFYGTPPEPQLRSQEAADYINGRNRVFEELIEFKHRQGLNDALRTTFSFPHIVNYVDKFATVEIGPDTECEKRTNSGGSFDQQVGNTLSREARNYRNRSVLSAWERELQSSPRDAMVSRL